MVLPGFGWPTFHMQGCDNARHTQRLILTHLPSCFQLLKHQRVPQDGRVGVPRGPTTLPWQGIQGTSPPVPVGWGWQGAVDRALRWPITLNTVLHLKNSLQLCELFFIRGHQDMGKLQVSDSILAVRNSCFSNTVFFHPDSNLFSVSVNPFTDILFIGYFRWFVVG